MRKWLSIMLICAFLLALWGCSTERTIHPTTAPSTPSTPSTPSEPSTPSSPSACEHRPEIILDTPATCTEPGSVTSVCPLCGEEFVDQFPPLGHSFSDANCTQAPCCSLCGYVSGSALGHVYTDGICLHCGHQLPQDIPVDCQHDYVLMHQTAPGCTTSGGMDYQCRSCNHTYSQTIAPLGHHYSEATCTAPAACNLCGNTTGEALGHSFRDGSCTRCGDADPDAAREVTYTVTIRSDKGVTVAGVTVSVYTDGETPAATATTNAKGVATMTLMSAGSYRVVLSNVPAGLSAKESYTFKSTRVNINLSTVSVISPTDHSQANYKVGATMGDFTLTDTDGNTYTLSQLLKEKDLVILNFWYVNCGPCKQEFPYFEAIHEKYDNVQLLTFNHIDQEKDILALREQMGVTFPMIYENIGFQQGFGINSYPTTIFIAPSGKILKIQVGDFDSQAELEALIDSLI